MTARQEVEDGIIDAISKCWLKSRNPENGYLRSVKPYNGNIDETDGPDDLKRALCGASPSVLVSSQSAIFDSQSTARRRYKRILTVEIYVASSHFRSHESRTRSDVVAQTNPTADPGVYQVIEDIQQTIAGECFFKGMSPIRPVREDVILQMKDFTLWRLTYETRVEAHRPGLDFSEVPLTGYSINENIEGVDPGDPPNPIVEADDDTLQD